MATVDTTILLKLANSELLTPFLHNCVDELTGRKQVSFENYSSDLEWTRQDCENARNVILRLYKNCVLNEDTNLDAKLTDLPQSLQEAVKDCFSIRKEQILQAVLQENLMKTGQPIVENIDWKLSWVLGSSKLITISEPLLKLDLHCLQNSSDSSRTMVSMEMNLERMNEMINELERVKAQLDEWK